MTVLQRVFVHMAAFAMSLASFASCTSASPITLSEDASTVVAKKDAGPTDASACTPTPPTKHRSSPAACMSNAPDASAVEDAGDAGPFDECLTDQDCGPNGICSCIGNTLGLRGGLFRNVCLPGNCRTDADCGPHGLCSPSVSFDAGASYGVQGYYCHTAGDTCGNDSDCCLGPAVPSAAYCGYSPAVGHWACGDNHLAG